MISVIFCGFSLVGAIGSYLLPHETMGRALDYKSEDSDREEDHTARRNLIN